MGWEFDWNAVAAIGQVAGAWATFGAIGLALKQAKDAKESTMPRLKLHYSIDTHYIRITLINVGLVPAVLQGGGLYCLIEGAIYKIQAEKKEDVKEGALLEPAGILEFKYSVLDHLISVGWADTKFAFRVSDHTGKKHIKEIPLDIKKLEDDFIQNEIKEWEEKEKFYRRMEEIKE